MHQIFVVGVYLLAGIDVETVLSKQTDPLAIALSEHTSNLANVVRPPLLVGQQGHKRIFRGLNIHHVHITFGRGIRVFRASASKKMIDNRRLLIRQSLYGIFGKIQQLSLADHRVITAG